MTTPVAQPHAELIHLIYFVAPPVPEVMPYAIPKHMEVVEIVTAGEVYFNHEGRALTLGCGAVFWHGFGDQTIFRTNPSAPYECLALSFRHRSFGVRSVPRLSVISDHLRTKDLCHELLRAYHNPSVERQMLANYARQRLLWETHLGAIQLSAQGHPAAVEMALLYLTKNFKNPSLSVGDLAKAAEISEPHLHLLFRTSLGQTPHQALLDRRIQEAKWLLSGTTRTIKMISEDCGFLNIETFYRVFKKHVGQTPHVFRKQHRTPMLKAP